MRSGFYVLLPMALVAATVHAQSPDATVLHVLKHADRSLAAARVWHRVPLSDDYDLVLAMGATAQRYLWPETGEGAFWGAQKLGIFLQDRVRPGQVFTVTVAEGLRDCFARILRATATDTVIGCSGEKSEIYPNQKFVYDIRAKRLVSRVEYEPFAEFSIRRRGADRARITTSSDTLQLTIDFSANGTPEFQIVGASRLATSNPHRTRSGPDFPSSSAPFGPAGAFRLAEIDDETACGTDHRVVLDTTRGPRRHGLPPSDCDRIGPWAIEGDRLWFGRAFYSGEGNSGTGGFGYFDAVSRTFQLFFPPEIRDWSTTAILVQPDAIWLALAVHGEYASSSGGIVRYDRQTNTLARLDVGDSIGHAFVALGDRILVALDNGVAVIQDGAVKRYIVDKTTDGRLRVAEAFK